jgi:dihydrodipicolinate synthase/N-acetylneuraminate lyase
MPAVSSPRKALPGGIYVPTVTFFKPTAAQELDVETYVKHIEWIGRSGVAGITVQGSTGEAVALSREERNTITAATRAALDRVHNSGPVIVGTVGAQSTAQAIELARDGYENGGEFALVLPPSYYASALTTAALQSFYEDVADASPIPILIYSYPGVSSGIDMDTDLLQKLAVHPNIAGIKHTDHNLGKIARLSSLKDTFGSAFAVLGGASDYLLSALVVGSDGAITGMGNVCPRACVKAMQLFQQGKVAEATKLAGEISRAEWALGKGGITGVKYSVTYHNSLPESSSLGRKPLPPCSDTIKGWIENEIASLVAIERQLEQEAGDRSGGYGKGLYPNGNVHKSNGVEGVVKKVEALVGGQ